MKDARTQGRRRGAQNFIPLAAAALLLPAVAAYAALPRPAHDAKTKAPQYSQYDVEAVYLYDFAKFVRWPPAAPGSPLTICVVGNNPFGGTLDRLVRSQSVDHRPLATAVAAVPQAAESCSIVFLSGMDDQTRGQWLTALRGRPILTVSDSPGFMDSGGMVQFVVRGRHVRFSVNLTAANRDGVRISSELLKVALAVKGKPLLEGAR